MELIFIDFLNFKNILVFLNLKFIFIRNLCFVIDRRCFLYIIRIKYSFCILSFNNLILVLVIKKS